MTKEDEIANDEEIEIALIEEKKKEEKKLESKRFKGYRDLSHGERVLHRLNICSYDEYLDLFIQFEEFIIQMNQELKASFKEYDRYRKAQNDFNRRVAERLYLDKIVSKDDELRGVYG